MTILHLAVQLDGMAEFVKAVVDQNPDLATCADIEGRTPLMPASRENRLIIWRALHLRGRYEVESRYPVHTSATCRVFFAKDLLVLNSAETKATEPHPVSRRDAST